MCHTLGQNTKSAGMSKIMPYKCNHMLKFKSCHANYIHLEQMKGVSGDGFVCN